MADNGALEVSSVKSLRVLKVVTGTLLLVLLAASCSDNAGEGHGQVPSPVPDEFPIYAGAEIGASYVDQETNRTWFELHIDDDVVG